jgi:hypothetical protein
LHDNVPDRTFFLLCCRLFFLLPSVASAELDGESMDSEPVQERSLGQKVMDGYHGLKNGIAEALGGYSGDSEADRRAYMEHYRDDLSEYHKAVRKARAEYRRARIDDQKAYLEHHSTLPIPEDIDHDSGPLR